MTVFQNTTFLAAGPASERWRSAAEACREDRVTDNLWNLDEVTRADMRLLLATLREYSGYALTDCPVFKPFGASVDLKGAVGLAVAQLGGQPELSEYRDALVKGFRGQAERGEIRAAGYAQLGRHQLPGSVGETAAVLIRIECRVGVCGLIAVPYSMEAPDKVSFGESYIMRDEPWVWMSLRGGGPAEPGAAADGGA